VLPFENLSPDPADAYIALAVPESTLDRLASLRNLTVIARDSAFKAGRDAAGARELGRQLGAAWLVQGSTQRQGGRVLVTARLVDARTDAQVWSGRFERPLEQLYRLQDEIANGITDVLVARLTGLQRGVSGTDYSPQVEANLAFLRGRALLGRYTVAEAEAAAQLFERAVAADPRFAAAHAALYDARMQAAALRRQDLAAARSRHAPLIVQAFASDARSGAAHLARARWSAAASAEREADFLRGLELEPSNARGMVAYSELLGQAGRRDDARRWLDRALVIDPLSPQALFRRAMGTFDAAGAGVEREMLAVLERDPAFYPALQRYSKYRWQLAGETAQAIEIIERAIASDPDNPWGRHIAVAFYLDVEQPGAALTLAGGTPVSDASTATLRAQFAGDFELAARSAMRGEAWAFGDAEAWGVAEALRDAALRRGRGSPEERKLDSRFGQDSREGNRIGVFNYRGRLLLAHLKLARGERSEAERDLRELIGWMNTNERFGLHHRPRALALMLLGETDRALEELAASVEQDRDYRHWWYFFDREPIWAPVRSDPRFRAVRDAVRVHVGQQRAKLEALRASGQVPRRG
jgi:TolB-like protein